MSGPIYKELTRLVNYNPSTGVFTLRVPTFSSRWGDRSIGDEAGTVYRGCRTLQVFGKRYAASDLAWLYTYGVWPTKTLDHKNGNPGDNRISNLREATSAQNAQNSRSSSSLSATGTYQTNKGYCAHICFERKQIHLGTFASEELASLIYEEAKEKLFKEFRRRV